MMRHVSTLCLWTAYEGEVETVCGTYTGKDLCYYNETVQCGGKLKGGDSVRLEQTGCTQYKYLCVFEIKVCGQGKY